MNAFIILDLNTNDLAYFSCSCSYYVPELYLKLTQTAGSFVKCFKLGWLMVYFFLVLFAGAAYVALGLCEYLKWENTFYFCFNSFFPRNIYDTVV